MSIRFIALGVFFSCLCFALPSFATTFSGTPVSVNKAKINVGDAIPAMNLTGIDLTNVRVGGSRDYPQIIATILSLDMPVCQAEVKRLEQLAKQTPSTRFVIVSNESPFALRQFAQKHHLRYVTLASDFRNEHFGRLFGTDIQDTKLQGLNTRAVFIISKEGRLIYTEKVAELNRPPNYKNLIVALKQIQAQHQIA